MILGVDIILLSRVKIHIFQETAFFFHYTLIINFPKYKFRSAITPDLGVVTADKYSIPTQRDYEQI